MKLENMLCMLKKYKIIMKGEEKKMYKNWQKKKKSDLKGQSKKEKQKTEKFFFFGFNGFLRNERKRTV